MQTYLKACTILGAKAVDRILMELILNNPVKIPCFIDDYKDFIEKQKVYTVTRNYYTDTNKRVKERSMKLEDLIGESRLRSIVVVRYAIIKMIYNNHKITLQTIGDMFGGRHHTTIINGLSKFNDDLVTKEEDATSVWKELEEFVNNYK
jgi:chromosomal replication initiation ATPase DnaA